MKQEISDERVWPYILPFPLDSEKRGLIWSILQSRVGLKILENVSACMQEKMGTPSDLLKHGATNVVLTKGTEGCEIFFADEHREFSGSSQLQAKFKTVDSTGAGDGFSAGLIKCMYVSSLGS